MAAAAAAEWKEEEERSAPEEKDIEDCPLSEDEAGDNSLNTQRWPQSFRCVPRRIAFFPPIFYFLDNNEIVYVSWNNTRIGTSECGLRG